MALDAQWKFSVNGREISIDTGFQEMNKQIDVVHVNRMIENHAKCETIAVLSVKHSDAVCKLMQFRAEFVQYFGCTNTDSSTNLFIAFKLRIDGSEWSTKTESTTEWNLMSKECGIQFSRFTFIITGNN